MQPGVHFLLSNVTEGLNNKLKPLSLQPEAMLTLEGKRAVGRDAIREVLTVNTSKSVADFFLLSSVGGSVVLAVEERTDWYM